MLSKHKNWSATGNDCRSNASLSDQRFKKMLEKQKIVEKNWGNGQNYKNQNVENQKELRKPCKPSQRRKDEQNVEKRIFRTSKSELSQRRKELITTTKITTSKRTSKVIMCRKTTFDVLIILNAIGKIRTSKV